MLMKRMLYEFTLCNGEALFIFNHQYSVVEDESKAKKPPIVRIFLHVKSVLKQTAAARIPVPHHSLP
jgi:hypothetical protein